MVKKKYKNFYTSGTTLVELVVVIFIFIMITGVTIFNYGKFNSSISIQNLADDIALTVRRAQSYAIGVRGYGDFSGGYGIHFSPKTLVANQEYKASNKSFVLFTDIGTSTTRNEKYDYISYDGCGTPESGNECIEILNILSTDAISSITVVNDGSKIAVPSDGSVEILFYRPNPEPIFCYRSDVADIDCDLDEAISSIEIGISNTSGQAMAKTVTVSNNGQISVSTEEN